MRRLPSEYPTFDFQLSIEDPDPVGTVTPLAVGAAGAAEKGLRQRCLRRIQAESKTQAAGAYV